MFPSYWIGEYDPENSYGILKTVVWNTRDGCSGYANYIVTWKPVYDEERR